MANVQLPSFNTTPTDIDNAGMGELKQVVKSLLNSTIQLNEELTFLLNNLDTRNVNELNAEVIVANSITADKIQAKAITAEKIDVQELSAISADLGHITAGLVEAVQIFGSYIATSNGSYPFVEMSNTNNMFGAYKSSVNALQIYSPSDFFSPTIKFITPVGVAYITYLLEDNAISVTSNDANINISTARRIELFAGEGVYLSGWDALKVNGTGHSLQEDFVMK